MVPGRVSNPGPLTYESGALPIALRGPAIHLIASLIGVGRFRILGGQGLEFWGVKGGGAIHSRHMTS